MVSHSWGDEGVDWEGINDAAAYISNFCSRWGRLGGSSKEKFGTVRFYAMFGYPSLHTLIYPGYCYNQFPKWLWDLDCKYLGPILNLTLGKLFSKCQKLVYKTAYKRALIKWPHLREEILCCADWPEFLTGVYDE